MSCGFNTFVTKEILHLVFVCVAVPIVTLRMGFVNTLSDASANMIVYLEFVVGSKSS